MRKYYSIILLVILFWVNRINGQTPWDYVNSRHIYNTNSGYVGISSTGNPFTPSEQLEVIGNLKLSNGGGLKAEGTSYNLGNFSIGTQSNLGSTLNIYSSDINRLFLGGNTDYGRFTFTDHSTLNSFLDVKCSSDGYFNFSNATSGGSTTQLLRINNNGNVGIGTTTPSYKLDVNGVINGTDILRNGQLVGWWSPGAYTGISYGGGPVGIGTDVPNYILTVVSSDQQALGLKSSGTGTGISFSDVNGSSTLNFVGGYSGHVDLFNDVRILNSNGNIGINNFNPNYKLDVGGSINATDILKNGQSIASSQWSTNGQNIFYNTGNVGIGTNNPQNALDIANGSINVSSDASQFPLRLSVTGNTDWGIEFTGMPTNKSNKINNGNNKLNLKNNSKQNNVSMIQTGMGLRIRDDSYNGFYIKDVASNQNRMVITGGKVGIATDNPSYTLDVNGTVNASTIYQNGQPIATSQWQNNGSSIYYSNGLVGLNTNNPVELLQLGDRFVFSNGGQKILGYNYHWNGQNDTRILQDYVSNVCFTNTGDIQFRTAPQDAPGSTINWTNSLFIKNNGSIGIGTSNLDGSYALSVLGHIRATEIKVETGWSDFVFKPEYKLKSVDEVEKYIKDNGHLEGMPTEQEVKENGVELGNTTSKLLQKIEELTLYIIEQNKKIKELEEKINK